MEVGDHIDATNTASSLTTRMNSISKPIGKLARDKSVRI